MTSPKHVISMFLNLKKKEIFCYSEIRCFVSHQIAKSPYLLNFHKYDNEFISKSFFSNVIDFQPVEAGELENFNILNDCENI